MARKLDKLPDGKPRTMRGLDAILKETYSDGAFKRAWEMEMKAAHEYTRREMDRLAPRPRVYTARYPVHSWDGIGEHELRYSDGASDVEVWDGPKMVCRIPVMALQDVLLNELLEAVDVD